MPRENSVLGGSFATDVQERLESLGGVSNLLVLAGVAIGLMGSLGVPSAERGRATAEVA